MINTNEWDVFISYASEDRETVAAPLAETLRVNGLRVWYDQFELTPGKQLLQSIDEGLRESRFGIVVLSPHFFAKEWPLRELAGLYTRSIQEGQKPFIIPIWYQLNVSEIARYSPLLSNIIAIPWDSDIEIVVQKILSVINADRVVNPDQQYIRVLSEIYNTLHREDIDEEIKRILAMYPLHLIQQALEALLRKNDLRSIVRAKAFSILCKHQISRTEVINEILASTNTSLLKEIINILSSTNTMLSKEQIHILLSNPHLPRSTTGLGSMIRRIIQQDTTYSSEVFLPAAKHPSWEVKYDCIRSIIRVNDKETLRVLLPFSTMSYWKARRTIVEYIRERVQRGDLNADDRQIAEQILLQICSDGKTAEKTPTMRLARETLATLQGKALKHSDNPVISILFMSSDPTDADRLRLGAEIREIQERLQLSKLRDRFILHQRMAVRPIDIIQALLDLEPQIVHFSGHGNARGALYLEDRQGNALPVEPEALAALFKQFSDQVRCVILNACYSETQAKAISQHIEYVIGMDHTISDEAAIAFSVGFYQGLGSGRTIEESYQLGCVHIHLHGLPEHLTPVLLKRL
ncbi:TIR domain-containing protein [Chloroflexus aurantiacus]